MCSVFSKREKPDGSLICNRCNNKNLSESSKFHPPTTIGACFNVTYFPSLCCFFQASIVHDVEQAAALHLHALDYEQDLFMNETRCVSFFYCEKLFVDGRLKGIHWRKIERRFCILKCCEYSTKFLVIHSIVLKRHKSDTKALIDNSDLDPRIV